MILRHHVKVTIFREYAPHHITFTPRDFFDVLLTGDIKEQLKLWRALKMATKWKLMALSLVDNQRCSLLMENQTIKAYVNRFHYPMYSPFLNMIQHLYAIILHIFMVQNLYFWRLGKNKSTSSKSHDGRIRIPKKSRFSHGAQFT